MLHLIRNQFNISAPSYLFRIHDPYLHRLPQHPPLPTLTSQRTTHHDQNRPKPASHPPTVTEVLPAEPSCPQFGHIPATSALVATAGSCGTPPAVPATVGRPPTRCCLAALEAQAPLGPSGLCASRRRRAGPPALRHRSGARLPRTLRPPAGSRAACAAEVASEGAGRDGAVPGPGPSPLPGWLETTCKRCKALEHEATPGALMSLITCVWCTGGGPIT